VISCLFKEDVLASFDIVACLHLVVLDELHCVMTWGIAFGETL
jgi:superfamily II DNA helicase RecQ